MEDRQEKDYSFLGNDTFRSLYDALVYERKFKGEYLESQNYERLLKSEPSIVKLIENKKTPETGRLRGMCWFNYLRIMLDDVGRLSSVSTANAQERRRSYAHRLEILTLAK